MDNQQHRKNHAANQIPKRSDSPGKHPKKSRKNAFVSSESEENESSAEGGESVI